MAQGDLVFTNKPGAGASLVTGYIDCTDSTRLVKRVDLGFVPSELWLIWTAGSSATDSVVGRQHFIQGIGMDMTQIDADPLTNPDFNFFAFQSMANVHQAYLGTWQADNSVAGEDGGAGFWFSTTGNILGEFANRCYFAARR